MTKYLITPSLLFQKPKIGKGYKRREEAHFKTAGMIEFVVEIDDTHVQMSDTFLSVPLSEFWKQFKSASNREIKKFKIEQSENRIRHLKEQIQINMKKLELELMQRIKL
jgi:hypothetical protein